MTRKYKPRITKHDIKIGKGIARKRKAIGLTQEDLAEKVKITPQHLSYIENGHRRPSLVLLRKLSKELKITLVDLLG